MLWLVRVITDTFFRRIDVTGQENIPETGPVIFAGNHPNALMDGWLLSARCGRWPLHFLANAKLWQYRLLAPLLNAGGAVPVYRREDHDGPADNRLAFERLFEVLEAGHCVGIFPEGVSHVESALTTLKTGTARVALGVADRGKASACIVPCGLNYIHRHRFRSQVLIEFGEPIHIDDEWLDRYRRDEQAAVVHLTETLAEALQSVTLNAPDWRTLRLIQTARRLYKPATAKLTPQQYIELNRRFVEQYVRDREDPELEALVRDVEDYQAQLDVLGLKDHQLRQPPSAASIVKKLTLRTLTMLALIPLALPGALLHLPVGWVAATVGERFSYEMDDVATLKVFSTILLLPVIYVAAAILTGNAFGWMWGVVVLLVLPFSFFASVKILEAEAGLISSVVSLQRMLRFGDDMDRLGGTRAALVERIRDRVERQADPALERIFTRDDFASRTDEPKSG
jgi:1-acyl-sn-glycerol-3-phosphate acyltransferase